MVLISVTARGYHNFLWNTFSLTTGLHCQVCTTFKCLRKDIIHSCSYVVKAVYLFVLLSFHVSAAYISPHCVTLLCGIERKKLREESLDLLELATTPNTA